MIHHTLAINKDQHYGVNTNHDKSGVLLQLGDGLEQVRVQLTVNEVDQIISHLQQRRDEIRTSEKLGEEKQEVLPCGHEKKYFYFHASLVGSSRFRCIKCDDPNRNTRAMQELDGV